MATWNDGALHAAGEYDTRINLAFENDLRISLATGQHYPDAEWLEMRITPAVC